MPQVTREGTVPTDVVADVSIRLLGGLEIRVGDRIVDAAATGRRDPTRLAGYLALTPGHRAHREQVFDALWPDVDLEDVANRLHKAAHYLRKLIGVPGSVVLVGDTVALLTDVEVRTAVETFEQLARRAVDPVCSPGRTGRARRSRLGALSR